MSGIELRGWPRVEAVRLLDMARAIGVLSPLDQQFSIRLAALYGEKEAGIHWALAIASRQEAAGHVCADLRRLVGDGLRVENEGETGVYSVLATTDSLEAWLEGLRGSPLVSVVSSAGSGGEAPRPLVLDEHGRLYLKRAYENQRRLAESLRQRAGLEDLDVDWNLAESGIDRLVGSNAGGADSGRTDRADDAPRSALRVALARPLSIVTGGPGTGKTTLVVRLVALLIEQALARGESIPRVRLLAPTGKAAAAMAASFGRQRESLDLGADVRAALPRAAETIHRALHPQTRLDAFGKPRPFSFSDDVVIVDEASMVDLELMARLFDACRAVERVVLLGDPDQLTSVEAGAVLLELCNGAASGSGGRDAAGQSASAGPTRSLRDSIVRLRTSHRYVEGGGIGRLAAAISEGDAGRVFDLLDDPAFPSIERVGCESVEDVRSRLMEAARRAQQELEDAETLEEKLERMTRYRVLCAHRRGPLGVDALCVLLDEVVAAARHANPRSGWWPGRMLLVTQNAPDQDLWNGDVGLIEETGSGLRALFPDGSGGFRGLTPGRLPAHESAIAMSVHKSQGSEFDFVDLVLGSSGSGLMTRELLYTGVSRARSRLRIHASEAVIRRAVETRVSRDSGLAELLQAD